MEGGVLSLESEETAACSAVGPSLLAHLGESPETSSKKRKVGRGGDTSGEEKCGMNTEGKTPRTAYHVEKLE